MGEDYGQLLLVNDDLSASEDELSVGEDSPMVISSPKKQNFPEEKTYQNSRLSMNPIQNNGMMVIKKMRPL